MWKKSTWDECSGEGPASRSCSAACFHPESQQWYHFGGLGMRRHNDLWALDCSTMQWILIHDGASSDAPSKRCKASMSLYNGQLVLFGGRADGVGDAGKLNDLWLFDLSSKKWRQVKQSGCIPSCRSSHATTVVDHTMFLFGGIGGNKFGDMYSLNLKTFSWAQKSGVNPGPPRSSYGSLLMEEAGSAASPRLLLFGGLTCGQLNDVIALELTASSAIWKEVVAANPKKAPFKRGRHSSALLLPPAGSPTPAAPHQLLVFGGSNLRKRDNSLHAFDLSSKSWREIPAATAPPPMEGQAMCVVGGGTQLVVFSGWMNKGWEPAIYTLDLAEAGLIIENPLTSAQPHQEKEGGADPDHPVSSSMIGGGEGHHDEETTTTATASMTMEQYNSYCSVEEDVEATEETDDEEFQPSS